jgi:peptidoglycan/LPS O-acetylase OafA/YrhL
MAQRAGHLDGWRGVAILLVLQSHFAPLAQVDTGKLGVDIFFGLSGLLMSQLLFVERVPLATFYQRRISRILPAFLLLVAVVHAAAAWNGDVRGPLEIVATLAFLRTYLPQQPDIWHTGLPLGHLWSLNVEEHCYVFLGLLALPAVLRGREAAVLAAASLGCMALYWLYAITPSMAATSFEVRTEVAALPLLVSAGYFLLRPRVAPLVRPWMPLAALAVAAAGHLPQAPWWVNAFITPLALAFCVNHLGQAPRWLLAVLGSRPLRQIGLWSYSIYLWQQPFYIHQAALPPGTAVLGALAAGLASFYLVEHPLRRWINARLPGPGHAVVSRRPPRPEGA